MNEWKVHVDYLLVCFVREYELLENLDDFAQFLFKDFADFSRVKGFLGVIFCEDNSKNVNRFANRHDLVLICAL